MLEHGLIIEFGVRLPLTSYVKRDKLLILFKLPFFSYLKYQIRLLRELKKNVNNGMHIKKIYKW